APQTTDQMQFEHGGSEGRPVGRGMRFVDAAVEHNRIQDQRYADAVGQATQAGEDPASVRAPRPIDVHLGQSDRYGLGMPSGTNAQVMWPNARRFAKPENIVRTRPSIRSHVGGPVHGISAQFNGIMDELRQALPPTAELEVGKLSRSELARRQTDL